MEERDGREGRERWKRGKREREKKEEREVREEKEEKLGGQAEFTTQEKKGPHCGPRFSFLNIPTSSGQSVPEG